MIYKYLFRKIIKTLRIYNIILPFFWHKNPRRVENWYWLDIQRKSFPSHNKISLNQINYFCLLQFQIILYIKRRLICTQKILRNLFSYQFNNFRILLILVGLNYITIKANLVDKKRDIDKKHQDSHPHPHKIDYRKYI